MRILLFPFVAITSLLSAVLCEGQVTFTPVPDQKLGQVTVSATTSDGKSVTFSTPGQTHCAMAGADTVNLLSVGSCTVTGTAGAQTGATTFQIAAGDQTIPGVDAVFGIGSLITGKHTDYKVNTAGNVLQGTQIGRASPQLLAGVAFQLPIPALTKKAWESSSPGFHPWHAFVSLKFSPDSTQTIVGYTFGITYRVMPHLDLLAGYALTPFQEPSPGFIRAAVQAVQSNLSSSPNPYATFNGPALNNNVPGAFDGFPLQVPKGSNIGAVGSNLYAGEALETHYRGGFMIGVSVPVSLNGMLGIPKK